MDELPARLADAIADETVVATVDVGGGDVVAVTRTRTHLYRSDGLLSDETVDAYEHDVDRFAVDPGRRKASILLRRLDSEDSFTVPSSVVDDVVAAMLEGILRTAGTLADDEIVEAQFRFSELTLVVTDRQLLRHVGSAVWDDDFEAYRYEDLGDLDFEEGSVATQIVLEMDGRQHRVKVPNDHAGRVRQEIQSAIFAFHGVSSLGGLRETLAPEEDGDDGDEEESVAERGDARDDEGATVGDADSQTEPSAETRTNDGGSDDDGPGEGSDADAEDGFVSADWSPPADQDVARDPTETATGATDAAGDADAGSPSGQGSEPGSDSDVDDGSGDVDAGARVGEGAGAGANVEVQALAERVDDLSERVEHQTELLEAQQETIEQLVDELRRGR